MSNKSDLCIYHRVNTLASCRPKGLTSCRGNLPPPFPADKNAVAADCRRYRAFRNSILHFRRGNVPFVLAATFRARLFLFPVDCSLFPFYYPLLFHQQLDKSELIYSVLQSNAAGAGRPRRWVGHSIKRRDSRSCSRRPWAG